jgi:ribosomal protein L19E
MKTLVKKNLMSKQKKKMKSNNTLRELENHLQNCSNSSSYKVGGGRGNTKQRGNQKQIIMNTYQQQV